MGSKTSRRPSPRERITQVVEGWFLTEPLLFAAWTLHDVVEQPSVETIRVGRGQVQYNPEFVASLRKDQLQSVLAFEATRILLGHPYQRRQSDAELSYQASNLTVQECLRTGLPIERARDVFGDPQFDDQYFEFYYRQLFERRQDTEPDPPNHQQDFEQNDESDDDSESGGQQGDPSTAGEAASEQAGQPSPEQQDVDSDAAAEGESSAGAEPGDDLQSGEGAAERAAPGEEGFRGGPLESYCDAARVGAENTSRWEDDDLIRDEIAATVRDAADTSGWGSIGGRAKEQLLATLQPRLDYRAVLRRFRQSVLSVDRELTRMKPSRRYGFAQLGSRYRLSTRLLFAVDVSGSMGSRDLQWGFSVVRQFFRYGVSEIDVVWFDDQLRCEPFRLDRRRRSFEVSGRGGTDFRPVMELIDRDRSYDGLIVFTDGYAPVPPKPSNGKTRVLWLFKDEATCRQMREGLRPIGRSAFLKRSPHRVRSS